MSAESHAMAGYGTFDGALASLVGYDMAVAKGFGPIRCEATLKRPIEGGDWAFLRLPAEASSQLPSRSMVGVDGKLNGHSFTAVLEPDSEGGHWLKVPPDWLVAAEASFGSTVELELRAPAVEPEPEVPEDLAAALLANPAALEVWNDTTTLARRDWVTWMTQGKQAETRVIRLNKMMDMLSKGKRRVCCFDRSGMASKAFQCPIADE